MSDQMAQTRTCIMQPVVIAEGITCHAMRVDTTTKPNPKAAWTKELHAGQEGSAWRAGAEIVDSEMRAACGILKAAGLPYTARDLVRLTKLIFKSPGTLEDIARLAKARLDCEGIAYAASDLVELIALFVDGIELMMEDDDEDHMEVCADCAGQARH